MRSRETQHRCAAFGALSAVVNHSISSCVIVSLEVEGICYVQGPRCNPKPHHTLEAISYILEQTNVSHSKVSLLLSSLIQSFSWQNT